jgi:hypothetical protein
VILIAIYLKTEWNKLNQSIKTLYFNYYSFENEKNCIQILDTLQFFDNAITIPFYGSDQEEFNFATLKNYKLSPLISGNSYYFTIVKSIK